MLAQHFLKQVHHQCARSHSRAKPHESEVALGLAARACLRSLRAAISSSGHACGKLDESAQPTVGRSSLRSEETSACFCWRYFAVLTRSPSLRGHVMLDTRFCTGSDSMKRLLAQCVPERQRYLHCSQCSRCHRHPCHSIACAGAAARRASQLSLCHGSSRACATKWAALNPSNARLGTLSLSCHSWLQLLGLTASSTSESFTAAFGKELLDKLRLRARAACHAHRELSCLFKTVICFNLAGANAPGLFTSWFGIRRICPIKMICALMSLLGNGRTFFAPGHARPSMWQPRQACQHIFPRVAAHQICSKATSHVSATPGPGEDHGSGLPAGSPLGVLGSVLTCKRGIWGHDGSDPHHSKVGQPSRDVHGTSFRARRPVASRPLVVRAQSKLAASFLVLSGRKTLPADTDASAFTSFGTKSHSLLPSPAVCFSSRRDMSRA